MRWTCVQKNRLSSSSSNSSTPALLKRFLHRKYETEYLSSTSLVQQRSPKVDLKKLTLENFITSIGNKLSCVSEWGPLKTFLFVTAQVFSFMAQEWLSPWGFSWPRIYVFGIRGKKAERRPVLWTGLDTKFAEEYYNPNASHLRKETWREAFVQKNLHLNTKFHLSIREKNPAIFSDIFLVKSIKSRENNKVPP